MHRGEFVIQFDAAPAIPSNYPRLLEALTLEEIGLARAAGFVADGTDPRSSVRRSGLDGLVAVVTCECKWYRSVFHAARLLPLATVGWGVSISRGRWEFESSMHYAKLLAPG